MHTVTFPRQRQPLLCAVTLLASISRTATMLQRPSATSSHTSFGLCICFSNPLPPRGRPQVYLASSFHRPWCTIFVCGFRSSSTTIAAMSWNLKAVLPALHVAHEPGFVPVSRIAYRTLNEAHLCPLPCRSADTTRIPVFPPNLSVPLPSSSTANLQLCSWSLGLQAKYCGLRQYPKPSALSLLAFLSTVSILVSPLASGKRSFDLLRFRSMVSRRFPSLSFMCSILCDSFFFLRQEHLNDNGL